MAAAPALLFVLPAVPSSPALLLPLPLEPLEPPVSPADDLLEQPVPRLTRPKPVTMAVARVILKYMAD
jgi:hypothetical protein